MLTALIKLLRPKQWPKNLLVFSAVLFTARFDQDSVSRSLIAFVAMCLVSSSVYVINDIFDQERDRAHPKKKFRPIAAGDVTTMTASILALALLGIGGGLAAGLGLKAGLTVLVYLLLQALYNLGAKRVAVVDVFIIAIGFVLRAAVGAAAIHAKISGWLILCTGALALLVGFGKRRHEFLLMGADRQLSRASLNAYSRASLDALVIMTACASAMCYGIYALDSPTAKKAPGLFFTVPFVLFGICRYVLLAFGDGEAGEPESILAKDLQIQLSILGFLLVAFLAMRGSPVPLLDLGGH